MAKNIYIEFIFINIKKYIVLLLFLIIIGIILIPLFLNPVSKTPQYSNFKGIADAFWFQGQNSNVEFKTTQIILTPTNTTNINLDSVKNITIEYYNGEKRLINHSGGNGIQIRNYKGLFILLSNKDVNSNIGVNINFGNLTMNKYIEGALLNGSISYIYVINGGKVDVRSFSVDDVDIGNGKIKNFSHITFEIDNDSIIRFSPEISKLQTNSIYDLNIESQLSKMSILSREEGVLNLDSHKFDIKSADSLYIELMPPYNPYQSILVVKDTKIIFNGYTNLAKINNKDVNINEPSYWFEKQPEKINSIAVVISLFLTALASISTWRLVSMEADKKEHERQKFLNILLAEFETNSIILKDLKNSAEIIIKDPSKIIGFAFFGFKEDGFNTFRNQGGFYYINIILYNKITNYYTSLYRLDTTNKLKLSIERNQLAQVLYHATKGTLMKDIEVIEECTNSLRNELKNEMQKT